MSRQNRSRFRRRLLSEGGIAGPPATSYTPYDSRKGHGYGTIDPQFDITYKKGDVYPYVEPSSIDVDEESEDIADMFGNDLHSMDKFVRMINKAVYRDDPSRRRDRASYVSNQKVRLPESSIAMRKGDSLYGTMSPIPKKTLYGSFDGPGCRGFLI